MPETFEGTVKVVHTASGEATAIIEGDKGDLILGGAVGNDGDILLLDSFGTRRIVLDAHAGRIHIRDDAGNVVVDMGPNGDMILGGAGHDGDIGLQDAGGEMRIHLDAGNGRIRLRDEAGNLLCEIGPDGDLRLGGAGGHDGDVRVLDAAGQTRIHLDGQNGRLSFADASGNQVGVIGPNGDLELGGNRTDGDITLKDGNGRTRITLDAGSHRMRFFNHLGDQLVEMGPAANLVLGGSAVNDGDLILKDEAGRERLVLDAQTHRIILRDANNHVVGRIGDFANMRLGSGGQDGDILLFPGSAASIDDDSKATIHLDANAGDIILRNADCAEDFEVDPAVAAEPGTVMALGCDGRLRPSQRAHERGVVGVVSGGGAYRPGIVLDRRTEAGGARRPIALVGKAFVRVTDEGGPIEVGDLLTTSSTEGAAMKAAGPMDAFGAVIGKAIARHASGHGMIPMIIALQ